MKFFLNAMIVSLFLFQLGCQENKSNPKTINSIEYYPEQYLQSALPCIVQDVASHLKVKIKPELQLPDLMTEDRANMELYKKQLKDWTQIEFDKILNIYMANINRIYLVTDQSYYKKVQRSALDSLAHELVHYLQHTYMGFTKDDFAGDDAEMMAVAAQTWFREKHQLKPTSILKCEGGKLTPDPTKLY